MALVDTTWYVNSVGYAAVPAWTVATVIAAGAMRRQTAPAVGSERVFICIVAGTTHATTEPTWVLTRGAKTTDNTVTWEECTGQAALNGDLTNTATWAQVKAATPAVLGQIIKRSNNASYQICTTAGAMSASEPSFSDTAGVTTTDTTAVWTSLGVVGNFTAGGAPHARLASACASTWFAAGNTVYVGDNHAETQGSAITIAPAGGVGLIDKILCHNHSGSYPPAASDITTGATVSATGTFSLTFNPTGSAYVYGIAFKTGTGGGTGSFISLQSGTVLSQSWLYFDNCSFQVLGSISNVVLAGTTNNLIIVTWNNCTVSFGHVGDAVAVGAVALFRWQSTGPVLAGGSLVPTALFGVTITNPCTQNVVLEAIDLSQITGNLFASVSGSLSPAGSFLVKDCKLNATTTIATPLHTGMPVQLVRCDSGATTYKSARYAYEGSETTEISITRTGGAVDAGGQAQARKIVTTANVQWLRPFMAEPYAIYNATTGAPVTVTVYGTINSASLPNNDEIFMEVEYLGSAYPGIIVTTTKSGLLAANAAIASDNSSWNGGGSGVGWSPFKLAVTVTPGMAGVIEARIRAAKASTTYYIDPQIVLT